MRKFLASNETKYRLLRTILQGVIGVLISNVDLLIDTLTIPTAYKPMIVALVMAVLSPIMSELGAKTDTEELTDDEAEDWLAELENCEVEDE